MPQTSPLLGPVGFTSTDKPPTTELGAVSQQVGGRWGWASFVDESEFVPELSWPTSIPTYHRMRSDSQVDALHIGTVQPVREFRWFVDPNGATAATVENFARDLGLPIKGHEDDDVPISDNTFSFDTFVGDQLLTPIYGHFHHEIVGEVRGGAWRMVKLAPRHPRTLMQFQSSAAGDLLAIQQNIAGAGGWNRMPPPIPAPFLVTGVWRPEGGSHVGRSLLRSIYREWLVKDRTIRVAAINLERGGGVPAVYGPQGASDDQLRDLAVLARQFKVAEGGGGALPFGSKLELVGGHTPDAISLLKYCDECMARVWMLMLVQLGMTATGNRALGSEFAIYAARAQRAMAKTLVVAPLNDFAERYTRWNEGEYATHAPRVGFEPAKPESMSVADFVALVEAKALHVDPELELWLRDENGLPGIDLAALEALFEKDAAPLPAPALPLATDPTSGSPTLAAGDPLRSGQTTIPLGGPLLPDRPLRRPTESETRAGVNFRALDQAHAAVLADAQALFTGQVIPGQIADVRDTIAAMKTVTRARLAKVAAPVAGEDALAGLLQQAATSGANAAIAELASQGLTGVSAPEDAALAALVADQAAAVAQMAANGLSLAAQRKAASLVSTGGRTPDAVASVVSEHLGGMAHQWTLDQLQGAVTMAQNAGRGLVFADAESAGAQLDYESSELLDQATCGPCRAEDGKRYDSLAAGLAAYAPGGYVGCDGGPRCRGTLIAIHTGAEQRSGHPLLGAVV